MRLAWFSPWPPERSGVAGRSAEVVTRLAAAGMAVDVFVDGARVATDRFVSPDPPQPGVVRVQSAHDFVWRASRRQFDLVVYQLGNSRLHDYVWPYLFRWPGLTVLHDARLHHARGQALLSRRRADDYRAEFAFDQPSAPPEAAELAVSGLDGPYYYLWPMTRAVVEASRLTAVHAWGAARDLAVQYPDAAIDVLALGEGRHTPLSDDERREARAALGLADDCVAFGVFGALTRDKRLTQVLRAFAETRRHAPAARLVLAGTSDPACDVDAQARTLGITDALVRPGVLDDEAFDRAIAAVDVSVNLRWPSACEVSGPWLRALAAGRSTVTIDLMHHAHVPAIDPRGWRSSGARPPITVAIDILDEDHSLLLAFRRLAGDATERANIGRAARLYWETEHSEEKMIADYERVIARAVGRPAPDPALPSHLRHDPAAHLRELLAAFPEVSCELP